MRRKSVVWFVVCLYCVVSINAQTVVENESSILLNEKTADVSLVVDNPNKNSAHKITLELLDANDIVRSQTAGSQQLKLGKETYKLQLPINDLLEKNQADISWFRLRYQIGDTRGIISLSQIVKDIFEIRVIATGDIMTGMTYRNRIRATSPFTNQPIQGVKVIASLNLEQKDETKINLTAQGETDSDGFVNLEFQIPVEANLDDGELKVVGRKNGIVREANEDLRTLGNDFQFPMLADKPIYQPEQTLNVRGILLKGVESKTVVADAEVEFRVEDEEDTVLYREKVKTSAFGVASMTWKIPENAKLGNYRIRVKNQSDNENEYVGYQSIKISRYDLPNFAVNAKALKTYYLPNENQAEVEVNADYLFGKPVTKGKVRVVRETERTWNYKEQKYDINEGESHEGKTDDNGKFTAKFDLKDDHEDLKDSDYRKFEDLTFTAYFTDLTTNRTEQRHFDVRVTKEPIHVYFIGKEYGNHANLPVNAYVSAFYADGAPCECQIELKGREQYSDEKFKTILKTKTNSFGGGRLSFMRPKFEDADLDDDLDIKIIAKDKNGLIGTYGDDDESYYDKEVSFGDNSKLQIETDKTIFKPGEAFKVKLNAVFEEDKEQPSTKVYVDIVKGWSVVESYFVTLKNGKAELKIPYQPKFQGVLKIAAYFEEEKEGNNWNSRTGNYEKGKYFDLIETSRGIIFPYSENLKLDAKFDKETYKPAEEATATFSVLDSIGQTVESVLGIVIFDKAVEERARTEGEFNGTFKSYYDWLGYGDSFGGVNVKDLNELDLTKSIPEEMQLAAEIMLYDEGYIPNIFRSRVTATDAKSVYADFFKKQFDLIEKTLAVHHLAKNYEHPTDAASLNRILGENSIIFENLRDPWGNNYKAIFDIERTNDTLRILSAGADKKFGTSDDFTVSSLSFVYFVPTARRIDDAVILFYARTKGFIRDEKTLFAELGITELKDRFGRPYQILFETQNKYFTIRFRSAGKDGVFSNYPSDSDDFEVHGVRQDYFLATELKINKILQNVPKIPMSEPELKTLLKQNGVDLDEFRDGWGEKIYLVKREFSRFDNVFKEEIISEYGKESTTKRRVVTPVTQGLVSFSVRSKGADKKENTNDDFTFAEFAKVIWEQSKDDQMRRQPTENYPYSRGTSAINGTIKDVTGAVIANAKISLTQELSNFNQTALTSADGKYVFANIPPETYNLKIEANGFKTKFLRNITAPVNVLLIGDFVLEVETINSSTIFQKVSSNSTGSISGTVLDSAGSAIPNVTIIAMNTETSASQSATSNSDGKYTIANLISGKYNVRASAQAFKDTIIQNVVVTSGNIVKVDFTLEAGTVSEVVTVSSGVVNMETSSSQIQALSLNGQRDAFAKISVDGFSGKMPKKESENTENLEKSTPKLREYFPETLVWSPELLTNKDGKAELKFKMGDNITTWKLYTIASTKNGKFGVAEKEVTAFQPFFVDLDPPKFLTESDEIYLPVQVRNYTQAKQKVEVTMAKADWFSFIESEPRALASVQTDATQQIEVDKNAAKNAVFGFKTITPIKDGKQRVTAIAPKDSDAFEKPVTVRPNGEEIVRTDSKLFANSAQFEVNFPENALPKTAKAELKIYPNLLAHVTESVEGLLRRPYGCGEQTISSTYPNLMILKFIKDENSLKRKAKKYLKSGYERLLGYQITDGGFSYWGGKDESNIALTAYALRFLNDAKDFIEVDQTVIVNATQFLLKQQLADGSFYKKHYFETTEDTNRAKILTTYIARTLARQMGGNATVKERVSTPTTDTLPNERVSALLKALNYLKTRNAEIDEPYALALYALANFDSGNPDEAEKTVTKLQNLAKTEGNSVYWNLETNTPFYGWGFAGRIETSALVIQALLKSKAQNPKTKDLISKGTMFLLKNKDRYGVWYSTQTTINVLDTFLASLGEVKDQTISVKINGINLKDFAVSAEQIEPTVLGLNDKLALANRVEITSSGDSQVMAQIVKNHYIDWKDSVSTNRNVNDSRAIKLNYKCDKLNPKIMETVTCSVAAERIGFKGYGMLLAEIGIPPGADVSRESLEKEFANDWSLSRYEVLPDRIIVYMWAKAGGSKFNFSFKPRYGIKAQTPASIVYDYYNEEAKATIAPLKFEVK